MASKDGDDRESQERLNKRVVDWLHKSGLPLEIATLAAFRAEGFDAEHSSYYVDQDSNKAREIDVVAWAISRQCRVFVQFNVECKSSPNPWIVVKDRKNPNRGTTQGLLGQVSAAFADSEKAHRKLASNPNIYPLSFSGHLLRQAFSGERDAAYEAALGVVKSVHAVFNQAPSLHEDYVSVQPVIVVDSKLFECIVSDDGSFELVDVELSSFTFTAPGPESAKMVIRIATRVGLPVLVKQCAEVADLIISHFEPREQS